MTWIAISVFIVLSVALVAYSRARVRRTQRVSGRVIKAKSAHAARANKTISDERDVFVPYKIEDAELGVVIDTHDKYVGVVTGKSCEKYGIKDGSVFLGDVVSEATSVAAGDFVVVDGKAESSNVGLRIRRVESANGSVVEFSDHRARPRSEVVAKITHILSGAA
ncbi:hypothetical protein GUK30_10215 [Rhizobium leguminosarum]|uniref:hypothetical protein n=1 Tax=Rhizobium ruizarguesonis TaxID=2081791 RepID=UPI0013C29E87|nr:hypothetical protein [Rhizobium ruizarguesonis]NEI19786.1 hypothetical protein [Rhizobium ruizarguesonis]